MTGKRERTQIATAIPSLVMVVTDDGSRTLKCLNTGVTWHSESGALAESQLVFLENSGIAGRLAYGQLARVLEIGFGSGLNFWITASLAIRNRAELDYVSCEPQLLDQQTIEWLEHGNLPECQPAFDQFFPFLSSQSDSSFPNIRGSGNGVNLLIHRQEFVPAVYPDSQLFDAIYHDPFEPDAAPDLWSRFVFQSLNLLLKPGGRLVTYCVKSDIQRALNEAGFSVHKTRGPVGGKREVLVAVRAD